MSTTPEPFQRIVPSGPPERVGIVWRAWLEALASDAEAALGAALAYETLDAQGREAFLEAIEQDAPRLDVPRVALFAPLLSVERDPRRRERIERGMGDDIGEGPFDPVALRGVAPDGDCVVAVVTPVYLDFVRVTSCRFNLDDGFSWVHDLALAHRRDAPRPGTRLDGVELEIVPVCSAVDEIAAAVVAQRRHTRRLPPHLRPLLDLFDSPACDPPSDRNR